MINVNNSGIVSGTAFNDPISGFWDQATGKLVFYRAINHVVINNQVQINPENIQIFTGYLFHYKAPGAFFSDTQVLAGTFESFAGTGATQQKNTFSWFAYRPQP